MGYLGSQIGPVGLEYTLYAQHGTSLGQAHQIHESL